MKKNDDLFQLIHSLSRTEKGYFKKYTSKHIIGEKNNYVRLFDAIDKQKAYDEEAIRNAFRGETFTRQLHSLKNYLYHLILESLRAYQSNKDAEHKIKDLLDNIEILKDKALYGQCRKLIRKAKALCYRHERWISLLEAIYWEDLVERADIATSDRSEAIQHRFLEQEKVLANLHELIAYRKSSNDLLNVLNTVGFSVRGREAERIKQVVDHALFHDENSATTQRTRLMFCNIHALYNMAINNYPEALRWLCRQEDILGNDPDIIRNNLAENIVIQCNTISCYAAVHDLEGVIRAKQNLQSIEKEHKALLRDEQRVQIFVFIAMHELLLYGKLGMVEEGLRVALETEGKLKELGNKISKSMQLVFYENLAGIYFMAGKLDKALHWNNRTINESSGSARMDVQGFARIMNLLIHFEMGHEHYLGYPLRASYRFLLSSRKLFKGEELIMEFLKKNTRESDKKGLQREFILLREKLIPLMNDPHENAFFNYFNFIAWLDHKIDGISLPDALKKWSNKKEAIQKPAK